MIHYTYEDEAPTGRAARRRRPRRRHEFTISRDHTVRAGGSRGEPIGRVELRSKRWFPFSLEGGQLCGDRGYRRAGDAGSVLYVGHLKAGGMPHQQLSLFAQYKRTAQVEDEGAPAKRSKKEPMDERSPEFQKRKRIKLCAEWYHFEEAKPWKQAYAMCTSMEEEGHLRDDGSYIKKGGQANRAATVQYFRYIGELPDGGDFDAQNGHVHDIADGTTTHFTNRYHTHVCPDLWPSYPFFPEIAYYETTDCPRPGPN